MLEHTRRAAPLDDVRLTIPLYLSVGAHAAYNGHDGHQYAHGQHHHAANSDVALGGHRTQGVQQCSQHVKLHMDTTERVTK